MERYFAELDAIDQLLATFVKENKNLKHSLQFFDKLDFAQRELVRESVRTNTQLATQINSELAVLAVACKNSPIFCKLRMRFSQECGLLENCAVEVLSKERKILDQYKSSKKIAQPEETTFLLERTSGSESEADYAVAAEDFKESTNFYSSQVNTSPIQD